MPKLNEIKLILLSAIAVVFIISTIVLSIKLKIERRKSQKKIKILEKQLKYDYLTGTLSRKAFIEEVESALAEYEEGTFLIFDLNGMRSVNDMFGHLAGDNLLKRYSAKLTKAFDKNIVGRLGGDEFLVFIPQKKSSDEIYEILKKHNIARFSDKPTQLVITACCGAAYAPKNGKNFDDLYSNADKALYYSKTNDKTVSFCKDSD